MFVQEVDKMRLIGFGNYTPPAPTEYSVDMQDIDSADTGRGETGYMNRERVRANLYKIKVKFSNITSDDVLAIKRAIAPAQFNVSLFDGDTVTANMYAGDRTLTLKSIDSNANCFWDMSFNLTEI